MKLIFTILLILGLLLGPGYFLYCNYFSGSLINQVNVFNQESEAYKKWSIPVALNLEPTMNPVSIVAKIKYNNQHGISTGQHHKKYNVTLKYGALEQWKETISLVPSKKRNIMIQSPLAIVVLLHQISLSIHLMYKNLGTTP